MNAANFKKLLSDLGACSDGVEWAKGKTLAKVWATLERADWMLWLIGKMADKPGWPTRKQVVLLAVDCAETVLPIWEKRHPGDERVKNCLEGTRKYLAGKITLPELRVLRAAAYAAYAAAAAAYAADAAADAAYAAYAAAYAAAAAAAAAADAADAYVAAYVAADAAYVAADAAAAARKKAHLKMCKIIRKQIPKLEVK
jgi:hypothetical protein